MSDWYEKKTIASLLADATQRWAVREAVFHEGRRFSFRDLNTQVDRVAKGLVAIGIGRGDKVVLWMPNRPEWLFAFLALSKIGAITVPANTRFRSADLQYVVQQSDARVLITVDRSGPVDYLALTQAVVPEVATRPARSFRSEKFPALESVVVLGADLPAGVIGWEDMLGQGEKVQQSDLEASHDQVAPDDTTLMLYTSGTTGFPKGVMHSHCIQRNVVDIANRMGYRSDDVILMNWPLFHVVGLYLGPLMTLVTGTRMVLTTTFDPAESLRLIEQERITRLWGFDTQLTALCSHPNLKTTDLRSLRTGLGAVGMTSSEGAAQRAQEVLCPTVSGWGMTEIGAGVLFGHPTDRKEDAWLSSGYPLPGLQFKVIDPATGDIVANGELGELCARGYSVMQGYYRKPEETAKAIDREGWLHTGDVATMRDDGMIRFLGRYKDLLKVGGENVDPAEVERFLSAHPAIAQVQVVGVADARLTEVVCACIVPKENCSVTVEDLDIFCRGKLASFKIPRYSITLTEFPMTASGKPQKYILRERAAASVRGTAS